MEIQPTNSSVDGGSMGIYGALYTIISNRTIHQDSLVTLFCEIEYMLNSRPLVELSDEPMIFKQLLQNISSVKASTILAPEILTIKLLITKNNGNHFNYFQTCFGRFL